MNDESRIKFFCQIFISLAFSSEFGHPRNSSSTLRDASLAGHSAAAVRCILILSRVFEMLRPVSGFARTPLMCGRACSRITTSHRIFSSVNSNIRYFESVSTRSVCHKDEMNNQIQFSSRAEILQTTVSKFLNAKRN